jgi:hypothetical protein
MIMMLMSLVLSVQHHGITDDRVPMRKDEPGAQRQAALPSALPLHDLPEADGIR